MKKLLIIPLLMFMAITLKAKDTLPSIDVRYTKDCADVTADGALSISVPKQQILERLTLKATGAGLTRLKIGSTAGGSDIMDTTTIAVNGIHNYIVNSGEGWVDAWDDWTVYVDAESWNGGTLKTTFHFKRN